MRCTPVRCMSVRCTPCETYACEIYDRAYLRLHGETRGTCRRLKVTASFAYFQPDWDTTRYCGLRTPKGKRSYLLNHADEKVDGCAKEEGRVPMDPPLPLQKCSSPCTLGLRASHLIVMSDMLIIFFLTSVLQRHLKQEHLHSTETPVPRC